MVTRLKDVSMKRTSIRLLLLRIPLRLLLWSLVIIPLMVEGRMPVDSLLTEKQVYTSREPIGFTVRLSSEAKPGTVRVIPTMSCSCSDRDFYYVVYRLGKGRGSRSRTVFLNHSEAQTAPRCQCKVRYANFKEGGTWSIPAINKRGRYQIEVRSSSSILNSNVFVVRE